MRSRRLVTGLMAVAVASAILPGAAFATETTKDAGDAVTEVGGKYYTTLYEAIDAGEAGQTINLLKDYETDLEADDEGVSYSMSDNAVLDLGTHTLKTTDEHPFVPEGKGVTIQNGSIAATGDRVYLGVFGDFHSDIKLKDVKADSGLWAYGATVTLEDCSVDAESSTYALKADQDATIIVKSGTYTSGKTALVATNGKLGYIKIQGGKFTYSGDFAPVSAKAQYDCDNVSVSGGTFTSEVPSDYIAEGYEQCKQADGTYAVGKHEDIVFADINNETAHVDDIKWLAAEGISEGWKEDDGTRSFRPYASVARADMAAFLYRMAGEPEYTAPEKSPFADVNSDTPHYKEICWLAEEGISKGWTEKDGTKTFRPYRSIARADMAAFLYRMTEVLGNSDSEESPFTDVNSYTSHYEEICWLAETGISEGWTEKDGTKTFRPYSDIKRADMAAFLHRMAGLD